jgi:hypothetical protein
MIQQFLIICIIVGAALYLVMLLPIDATVKTIIKVVVIVAFAIYALKLLVPLAGL